MEDLGTPQNMLALYGNKSFFRLELCLKCNCHEKVQDLPLPILLKMMF